MGKSTWTVGERVAEIEADVQVMTPLMTAAANGDAKQIVSLAVSSKVVNQKSPSTQKSALHFWAMLSLSKVALKALLEADADIDSKDVWGDAILHHLTLNDDFKKVNPLIKLILSYYPEVDIKNKQKQTPLMLAVQRGNKAAVKMLLEAGANVDAKDKDKQTAIDQADDPKILEMLLNH